MSDEAPLSFRRSVAPPPTAAAVAPGRETGVGPEDGVFRRRTAVILAFVISVSLLGSLVYGTVAVGFEEVSSFGADGFSKSAIGHHAAITLLRQEGLGVLVSRHGSARKAGPTAPLVLAEPILLHPGDESLDGTPIVSGLPELLREASARGAPVVVVLPKWEGARSLEKEGWVDIVHPVDAVHVADVLSLTAGTDLEAIRIVRVDLEDVAWSDELGAGLTASTETAQLIGDHPSLLPLVWTDEGTLVAKLGSREVYVISDPDLFNTAGLGRADNAALWRTLFVDRLGATDVVVDETLHGYLQPPSLWRELLTFPLLLVTLHVALTLLLALWAMIRRFGKPEAAAPRLPPGKGAIVESTAALLVAGDHHASSLSRYFAMQVQRTANLVALPAGLSLDEQVRDLTQLARARGLEGDLQDIKRQVDDLGLGRAPAAECVRVASRTHRVCQEIVHGHR